MTTTADSGGKDEAMAAVLHYLRKMGYRQTERFFREEAHISGLETLAFELRNEQDSNIANYLLFTNQSFDLGAYEEAYEGLRKWILESLDAFRDELIPILFPLFVHCTLDMVAKSGTVEGGGEARAFLEKYKADHLDMHEDEVNRLSAITEASQLKENPLAVAFRSNKYNVIMSAYTFQLLMTFLQDGAAATPANVLLLKIVNQFINIRVLLSKSAVTSSSAAAATGLTGATAEAASTMNKDKIQWGVNPIDPAQEAALQQRSKLESRLNEVLHGPLAHLKRIYTQSSLNAPSSDRIPKPPPTAADSNAEIDRLRHMAKKANLSAVTLPSICLYTLHNSYEGVTCVSFSPTSTLMATGNRDSYIDIWSLNHEMLKAIRPSTELAAMDLTDFESLEPMREFDGSLSKRLIGHSGPVYGCKFFHPDAQRFVISTSQDGTARLWSLDLFSCVVVYRGHNAAVWDVDVAPLGGGPYFVTASADRTARLWSTEHVQPLRIFAGHLSDVDVVKFHPNGNYIVTGSADRTCRLWDIQSGACVRLFSGHSKGVSAVAFTPDGRHLISADRSGQLRVWDLADGKPVRTLQLKPASQRKNALPMTPYSLGLDIDGRVLAVAGADQTLRLFEMAKLLSLSHSADDSALGFYLTKQTPIFKLHFTYRNVLLGAGPFLSDD